MNTAAAGVSNSTCPVMERAPLRAAIMLSAQGSLQEVNERCSIQSALQAHCRDVASKDRGCGKAGWRMLPASSRAFASHLPHPR